MNAKFLRRMGVLLALAGLLLGGWAYAQTPAEEHPEATPGEMAGVPLPQAQPEQQEYRVLDTTRAQFLGLELSLIHI